MKPQVKHWQDPLNALLGLWLMAAPWVVGYAGDMLAMGNSVVVGLLLVAAAVGEIFVPKAWEEWTEAALGLWMAASPWLLGYDKLAAATTTAFLTGLAVFSLSLWVLGTDKDYGFSLVKDRSA